DARGQLQQKFITSENVNNVYPISIATQADAPTGNWRAVVKAGGASFSKNLKIETVKPNRLKINLDFGKEELSSADKNLLGDLQVNWLHGAPAQNLKAKVEVQVKSVKTKFSKFNEYIFDDPARRFAAEPQVIFDGEVDGSGKAKVKAAINTSNAAPGKLSANFKSRAFEQGGDFSIDNFSMPYHPYDSYVGVYVPENKYKSKRLTIGEESPVDFAAVDKSGAPLRNRSLKIGLYKVNWRWWWDRDGYEDLSRYNSTTHRKAIDKVSLTTNQRGEVQWKIKIEDWGRYLIRVCDEESGHCSGDFFYAGSPWYSGDGQNRDAAAMLYFTADKTSYQVGETIELTVPASDVGRCLVSLESGSKVIETYWKDTKAGDNTYRFYATEEMAPTVYAHVTLVQPHAQVENDLPIRMYGVIPIKVENPKNKLEPELKMAEVLEPEQKVSVEVKEKNGRPMAYTIAMVDEGLLDLTRFKTPNPLDVFYAREALGVNTWDVYDQVLGAYGGKLERILSIGGDGEVNNPIEKKNANRFKPVVRHLGPFYLKKGGKAKHEIVLPNYVGSVRTMLVASDNGAYGMTEKTTPVRKPLMILATLPRVLGPTEELQMPVSVFAMEDKVKNVTLSLEEQSGLVDIVGGKKQTISFNKPGEDLLFFNLNVRENVGVAKFKVTAKGGGEVATQEIEIEIRNPNPRVTDVVDRVIEAGETWNSDYQPVGMKGTNESIIELSNIPPINLGERLDYLIRYPHGCVEQTTSSGFPQLYVNRLLRLEDKDKKRITDNVNATIDRLRSFQRSTGDFAYWPGQNYVNEWGTNYAGHFLLEAKKLGYDVSSTILDRWIKAQHKLSREWQMRSSRYDQVTQAYRLYTLALANEPSLGAMNRLREAQQLNDQAAWRLAAAYAVAGKSDVAKEMILKLSTDVEDYTELSGSYGSALRDNAMMLETLTHMGERQKGGALVQVLSNQLSRRRWYGTHTTSYCLLAIGKFVGNQDRSENFTFTYQLGGEGKVEAGAETPLMQIQLPVDQSTSRNFGITNTTNSVLFARLISSGQPVVGDPTTEDNNLVLEIQYKTMNGKKLDPSNIMQGTDFVAEVSVRNPGTKGVHYEEMALSQIFPSGWEIHNSRMDGIQAFSNSAEPEYQDIRDDRVYTYFDLRKNKKATYRIQLNAAYQGRYYLPTVYCEAMYDNTISSQRPGQWVNVVPPNSM
ncbi:MAG: alpha-2-macroglobulin family protein, partial [Bacteroidota bacterium]